MQTGTAPLSLVRRHVHEVASCSLRRFDDWRSRTFTRLRANRAARKYQAFTMVGRRRFIDNLTLARRFTLAEGCVVECGVWRGGMSAALAEMLGTARRYYLFDSFEGLPDAREVDGPKALRWQSNTTGRTYYDNCAAEVGFAQQAMEMSGARDVRIVRGWFKDTLPGLEPGDGVALLRLDGDWYESTMQCLEALYPSVLPGGLVIVDDYYHWDGCARAVHDFLSAHEIPDRIRQSPLGTCYILKSGDGQVTGAAASPRRPPWKHPISEPCR